MELKLDGLAQEAVLDDDKINNGVWIHLDSAANDPETGAPAPLYLGGDEAKPQRVLVRSNRCRAIKDAEDARQKAGFVKIRTAKKKDRDGAIADSSILPEAERFSHWLVALDNFSKAGGIQQVDADDAKAIYGMSAMDSIVQQVREAAYDDNNYVAGPGTAAGNVSPSTPKKATSAAK